MSLDDSSNTPPRRNGETQYYLSDENDDASSHLSRNYRHHRHNGYGDDDEEYDHGFYCDRHADNDADEDNVSLISTPTKRRVEKLDPNNGRCLVENGVAYDGVLYCCCFPIYAPESDPDLLDSVEWFWNIPYWTLNLRTSRNIFRAGEAIAQMYQRHFWLLLPDEGIINQYHNALTEINGGWVARRETFPDLPDRDDYEYRFVPISDKMRKIAIIRQTRHALPSSDPPISQSVFVVFVYPFSGLPILKSHVHPKYVLLEAGRKLTKRVTQNKLTRLVGEYPLLEKVIHIYGA